MPLRAAVASRCPTHAVWSYPSGSLDLADGGGGERPPADAAAQASGSAASCRRSAPVRLRLAHAPALHRHAWARTRRRARAPARGRRLRCSAAGKAIALEHPELRPTRIDLDPPRRWPQGRGAVRTPGCVDGGPGGAARRHGAGAAAASSCARRADALQPVRLERASTGVFDDMTLQPPRAAHPAAGEVEIRVVASGAQFPRRHERRGDARRPRTARRRMRRPHRRAR